MRTNLKRIVLASALAVGSAAAVIAPVAPAQAAFHGGFGGRGFAGGGAFRGGYGGFRGGYRGYGYRGGNGFPLAAGVIGGLALGAVAANSYYGGYGYGGDGYGYGVAGYDGGYGGYGGGCYAANQAVYTQYGQFAGYRRVRVCN